MLSKRESAVRKNRESKDLLLVIRNKVLLFVLLCTMVLQTVTPAFAVTSSRLGSGNTLNKPTTGTVVKVNTWSDLMALGTKTGSNPDEYTIEGDYEVILTDDVIACCALKVKGNVHISSTSPHTIYREKGDTNFPVFTVDQGGSLTLGNNVTMSGKIAEPYDKVYTLTVKDGYGNDIFKKLVYPDETKTIRQLLNNHQGGTKIYYSIDGDTNTVIFEDDQIGTQGTDWDVVTGKNIFGNATDREAALTQVLKGHTNSPFNKGYKFDDWDLGGVNVDQTMAQIDGDVTIVAKWKEPERDYKLTVTDGYGAVIYENTNVDKTKTVNELMAAASVGDLTSETTRDTALENTLADVANHPYALGYTFKEWDSGDVDRTQTMATIGGNVLVKATWTDPTTYKFTVTDGYGNVIYEKANIATDSTDTIQTLMQGATINSTTYDLLTETSRNSALAATLTDKNSPYENDYTFDGWNYGKKSDGTTNIALTDTMKDIGGNVTVCAKWKAPFVSLIVSDGYGNVIYKKKVTSSEMNSWTTPRSLMRNAVIYKNLKTGEVIYADEAKGTQGVDWDRYSVNLADAFDSGFFKEEVRGAFSFTLTDPKSPFNLTYNFTGWNDGYSGGLIDKAYYNSDTDKIDKDVLITANWKKLTQQPLTTWADVQAAIRRDGYVLLGTATEKPEDRLYLGVSGSNYETVSFDNVWYDSNKEKPFDRFKITLADHVSGDDDESGNPVRYRLLVNGYKMVFTTSGVYGTSDTWPTGSGVQYKFFLDEAGHLRTFARPNSGYAARKADGTVRYHWAVAFDPSQGDIELKFYTADQGKGESTTTVDDTKKETPGYKGSAVGNFSGTADTAGYSAASEPPTIVGTADTAGYSEAASKVPALTNPTDTAGKKDIAASTPCSRPVKASTISDARYTQGGANNTQIFNKNGTGFFVHVNNGGNFDIEGATLTELKTGRLGANGVVAYDTYAYDSAPVVVDGGTMHFTSGAIKNNEVAYLADDSKSGLQGQGYNKDDSAGDENYLKSKAMSNTAGGIIFKNGAKAEITGNASVDHNKGDVGGILVQGANTDVTLGGNIPDLTNDTTISVVDGGHIDSNVGFHHAGAALVEDGATLRMVGPSSTMNNNVTWAKGGAVWATEFGTAGYANIDYRNKVLINKKVAEDREEGIFIMLNGTLDNNTAFLRGGAINVQSNHVHLLGGTISSNYSRVLGGGIYVEGDFPSYTYTLLLDQGYIGHNYAVRYWDLENSEAADTPANGKYDGYTVSQLNDILDRKLGSHTGDYPLEYTDAGVTPDISGANGTEIAKGTGYPNRTADTRAYYRPHDGAGGGVWLCPIGGTAIFHLHGDHEVIVDDNFASGNNASDKKKGTDLYLHSGTGHLLVSNTDDYEGEYWENEQTGVKVPEDETSGEAYSGPLYLINKTNRADYDANKNSYNQANFNATQAASYSANGENTLGVRIIDNVARNGGGIAANGTLLFGAPKDVYRHEAQLGFRKIWPATAETYPVTFKMFYVDTYNNNGLKPLEGYEFHLDGIAGNGADYIKSPETTGPNSGLQANGERWWTANTTIPISVETTDANGDTVSLPLYKLEYTGSKTSVDIEVGGTQSATQNIPIPVDQATGKKILDPSREDHMKIIYAIAKDASEQRNFKIAEWNIVIKEYNAAGMEIKEAEFANITSDQVILTKDDDVSVIDAGGLGKKVKGYSISFTEASFTSIAKNGDGPSVEKYINNKVHQDLSTFDEVFEYEIMAYVPLDATEVIIYDTLVESLMFVDNSGNNQFNDNGTLNNKFNKQRITNGTNYSMVVNNVTGLPNQLTYFDSNNSIGDGTNGTVARTDGTIIPIQANTVTIGNLDANKNITANNNGNTIYVKLDESRSDFESIKGKWVKLTFDVAVKPAYRSLEALNDPDNGWISVDESKKGSVNFLSELEEKAGVTVTKLFKNATKGLYYARGVDASGNTHNYIYVSVSPDKIRNGDNGVQPRQHSDGVEKDEYLALQWYELYVDGFGKYKSVSYPQYTNVNLWHATYDGTNEFREDVTVGNSGSGVVKLLDATRNTSINGHTVTLEDSYNYPVIQAMVPHSGVENQADYIVKYPRGGKSEYKTNIVTVDIAVPEKYVNNKVHEILGEGTVNEGAFDTPFEYEIMVYVPENATEIMIYDTLKDDLMFVDRFGKTQYKNFVVGTSNDVITGSNTGSDILNPDFNQKQGVNESPMVSNSAAYGGYRLTYFNSNNHKGDGTGTVASKGTEFNDPVTYNQADTDLTNDAIIVGDLVRDANGNVTGCTPNNAGKSIFIKIDENTNIEAVQGKWVKVVFKAQIKPSRYDEIVKKVSSENMYTTVAADKDPSYPDPIGYYYRDSDKTLYKENAIANSTPTANVYYTKDANGAFTVRNTGSVPATINDVTAVEGLNYRLEYPCDFIKYATDRASIPNTVTNSNIQPVYVRKGWNNTDATISWEKITDDGYVIDGEKLHDKTVANNPANEPIGVQENGTHAGLANKAGFGVKYDNEYHYVDTNTVTVVPKEVEFEFTKLWIVDENTIIPSEEEFINNLKLFWERQENNLHHGDEVGEITELYLRDANGVKDNVDLIFEKQENHGETIRYTWKLQISGLPKLRSSMRYFIEEIQAFNGFNNPEYNNKSQPEAKDHAHSGGTIINSVDDGIDNTHLTVTKEWDVADKASQAKGEIQVQLLGNGLPIVYRDPITHKPILDANNQKQVDPNSIQTLVESEKWTYIFRPLPRYVYDDNGNIVYQKDTNNEFILDENGNKIPEEMVYSIELLSDPEGYILSEDVRMNKKREVVKTTVEVTEKEDIDRYNESSDWVFVGWNVFDKANMNSEYQFLKFIGKEEYSTYIPGVDLPDDCRSELEETGGSPQWRYCQLVYEKEKVEEVDTYEVDLINTKPQIEKYINKDVHHETYFGNEFVYDILVYIPTEATEIEITDEVLPTLKLVSFLEPQLSGPESRLIESYEEFKMSNYSAPFQMDVAVHANNDHTVNGTVKSNKTAGLAKATITVDGNKFYVNVANIVPDGPSYVEYEHGEYVEVSDVDGSNKTYVLATAIPSDKYLVNNLHYRQVGETSSPKPYYVEAQNGTHIKVQLDSNPVVVKFIGVNDSIEAGYSRADQNTYNQVNSQDQKIGGRYVQVSFKAKFNMDKIDELKTWVNDSSHSTTPNSDLDWDVITTTRNTGWDNAIQNELGKAGLATNTEYIPATNTMDDPFFYLANILGGSDKIATAIKGTGNDKYYAAKGTDGKYYLYPISGNNIDQFKNQWLIVENGPVYYYLDGTKAYHGPASVGLGGVDIYRYAPLGAALNNASNNIKTSSSVFVPVVEEETYVVIDGEYYLEDVAKTYGGDKYNASATKYKKVDWGRGDGDVKRTNTLDPSPYTGNHAGVVNTASYDVLYGNGFRSTHKSNTVTVVPEIYELPSAGGIGNYLFIIFGTMLMSLALSKFLLKRWRKEY